VSHRFAQFARNTVSIALTFCFIFSLSFSAYGQAADETALRSLAEKFFVAFQKQDLDALMSLWSEKSADYATSKQSFQQNFTTNKVELKGTVMGKLVIDGDKASLRVVVDSSTVNRRTGKPVTGSGKLNYTLYFIKESDVWKISRFVSLEEELAAAITEAKTDEERKTLLEANKALQTIELQRALVVQGTRLISRSSYSQGMAISQLASSLAQELNDKTGMASALRSIATIHRLQNRYIEAMEAYQKSLKISEEIDDQTGISSTLTGIGFVYQSQGNYAQALDYQYKSLKIKEEIGDKSGIGAALGGIATAYQLQGMHEQALDYHRRSLKIREEIGDKLGIAGTRNNMGLIFVNQGKYAEAVENYQRSLKIKEEIDDKRGIGTTVGNLGLIYQTQGNYAQAVEYHKRSFKIAEEIGNKIGMATSLNSIGIAYHSLEDYAQAVEYFQRSLKIAEGISDKPRMATALRNIATLYQDEGDYAKSLDYYQQSFKIIEELGIKSAISGILNSLATLKELQGNYTEALELANKSAAIAKQIGDNGLLFQAYATIGQVHRVLNQLDLAQPALAEAIAFVEDWRNQVAGATQERQQFFATMILPYQEMIELLITKNNLQEALFFAERSKGRALLDVFDRGKISITKAMSGEEQQQEKNLNAELVSLNSQLYREKGADKPDQARLADLTTRLDKTRLQMEAFHTNLYAIHPELRVQRGEIRTLTSAESLALIPDNTTALLEFVVRPHETYLLVLTKNNKGKEAKPDLQAYKLNIKQKDLADLTHRFNQRITSRSLGFRELAAQLYNRLLKPAQTQLQNINTLVIVPDSVLWELPFQALLSAPNHYLLQDYAISYAPSLTVLKEMNSLQTRHRNSNAQGKTLLALGNPAIGSETAEKVTAIFMSEKLLPLPEAERQVKALQQIYGSKDSSIYIGTEAKEDRLKQEASNYKILHLATHGILNDANPMYSCLVLSQLQNNSSDDGLLEAWEIMKMDLNADLVILSACDTARGKVGAGEGMIGLAWSLFVAGCPTTVVSQWKVETESNTEFMIAFHKNLTSAKGQTSKAEALRQAALKLMKNKKYSHPFYWAPFVIIGDAS
jgi:CHAT domain-containing protein/tetratricopeptide (TPR) repeat protein